MLVPLVLRLILLSVLLLLSGGITSRGGITILTRHASPCCPDLSLESCSDLHHYHHCRYYTYLTHTSTATLGITRTVSTTPPRPLSLSTSVFFDLRLLDTDVVFVVVACMRCPSDIDGHAPLAHWLHASFQRAWEVLVVLHDHCPPFRRSVFYRIISSVFLHLRCGGHRAL